MAVTERYWHANCTGIDLSFITTGEHNPESLDNHEFEFPCPVCGKKHIAIEVDLEEKEILADQDSGGGTLTPEIVKNLEEGLNEEDVLNVDVMRMVVRTYDDFDVVGNCCSWCGEDIDCPAEVYLWGEPLRGKYVAINTFDKEECLSARLDSFREKQGKSALLIKYRG